VGGVAADGGGWRLVVAGRSFSVTCPAVTNDDELIGPPWGVADFFLVMVAGIAGAFAAGAVVIGMDLATGPSVVVSAVGMSTGHAAGLSVVKNRRNAQLSDLGLIVEPEDGRYLLFGAILQVVLALLFAPIARLVESDGTTQVVADQIAGITELGLRVAIVLLVGLVAPIMEEIAFRGVLLRAARRRLGDKAAIAATALVFSLFHWLGVDQGNTLAGVLTLVQLFLAGLLLGHLAVKHNRLGPAIFLHAGFNMLTLMALFFAPEALG
jgi:membrane protease YdiL (CAAX protease family)